MEMKTLVISTVFSMEMKIVEMEMETIMVILTQVMKTVIKTEISIMEI